MKSISLIHIKKIKEIKNILKKSSSGYILILTSIALPILLLGVKFGMDKLTQSGIELEKSNTGEYYKKCAREAVLAVAQNWNPGLTLTQQKDGIQKVADAVYNAHPIFHDSAVGDAVPGIPIYKNYKIDENPELMELKVSDETNVANLEVKYQTIPKYLNRVRSSFSGKFNYLYVQWLSVDKASDSVNRVSVYDELDPVEMLKDNYNLIQHEIYHYSWPDYLYMQSGYPTDESYEANNIYCHHIVPCEISSGTSLSNYRSYDNLSKYMSLSEAFHGAVSTSSYTKRIENDTANNVKIAVSNDVLETATDNQLAKAIPAECNVDIVLAIPVNGAASNDNNRDAASETVGIPMNYGPGSITAGDWVRAFPDAALLTPIYQMGQACKEFVKKFYHTRGVNMGLIPYSGKVSLSPDRTDWTISIPQFNDSSTNTQVMIGACLYGTQGKKDAPLKRGMITHTVKTGTTITAPYYWGVPQTACPIMCRRGSEVTEARYGVNKYFTGNLLSNENPNTDALKYVRMNLNPCYGGYANQLSMRCEKDCTYFMANPYYIIEPTADLVKIYEMCNVLFPIYDPYNTSNFIFLPIEWARNLFASWTNNPECSASNGGGILSSSDPTLSRPSKMASGRKKALILLVNKPDWFEPGEMTYLGFNNDASEFPVAESDKIDFSIDYSDTTKKFLDDTTYDGTIQGPKKILKYTTISGNVDYNSTNNCLECSGEAIGRLTFPHKGTIRLKVAPGLKEVTLPSSDNWFSICYGNGKFVTIASGSNKIAYNKAGTGTWSAVTLPVTADWRSICYGNGKFIAVAKESNKAVCSTTGEEGTWSAVTLPVTANWYSICYGNNKFVAIAYNSNKAMYSITGEEGTWSEATLPATANWFSLCYGDNKFITVAERLNKAAYSETGTGIWSEVTMPYNIWESICYGGGNFVTVSWGSNKAACSATGTEAWSEITLPATANWFSLCYGVGKFVAVADSYNKVAYSTTGKEGTWSEATLPISANWRSICYGDDKFIAIAANSNKVAISTDGINWTNKAEADDASLKLMIDGFEPSKVTEETEFSVDADKIPNSKDANGNYYIDFNMKNIKLLSAEITNIPMESLSPQSTNYKTASIINEDQQLDNLFWKTKVAYFTDNLKDITTDVSTEQTSPLELLKYTPTRGMRYYSDKIDLSSGATTSSKGKMKFTKSEKAVNKSTELTEISTLNVSDVNCTEELANIVDKTVTTVDYNSSITINGESVSGEYIHYTFADSAERSATIDFWKAQCSSSNMFSYSMTPKRDGSTVTRISTPYYADITFKADYGQLLTDVATSRWFGVCYVPDTGVFWAVKDNGQGFCKSFNGICWYHLSQSWSGSGITYSPKCQKIIVIGSGGQAIWRSTDKYMTDWDTGVAVGSLPWVITKSYPVGGAMAVSSKDGIIVVSKGACSNAAFSTDNGKTWTEMDLGTETYEMAYSPKYDKFFFFSYKGTGKLFSSDTGQGNWQDTGTAYGTSISYGYLEGPMIMNDNHMIVLDDSTRLSDIDYSTSTIKAALDAGDFKTGCPTGCWMGIEYSPKGGYYILVNENGIVKTYDGSTVSDTASIPSHTISYGGTSTTVGTEGATITIPATALSGSSGKYYVDVTTVGSNPCSASLNAVHVEGGSIRFPIDTVGGNLILTFTKEGNSSGGAITFGDPVLKDYCYQGTSSSDKTITIPTSAIPSCDISFLLEGFRITKAELSGCVVRKYMTEGALDIPSHTGTLKLTLDRDDQIVMADMSDTSKVSLNWVERTSGTSNRFTVLKYPGDGKFWAGGDNGTLAYSDDGITWTVLKNPAGYSSSIYGTAYGNGKYIVGAYNATLFSENGIDWVKKASPLNIVAYTYSVSYGNGLFVGSSSSKYTFSSTNGDVWGNESLLLSGIGVETIFALDRFIALGWGVVFSPDGVSWKLVSPSYAIASWFDSISYGSGRFVACGYPGIIAESIDGIFWKKTTAPGISNVPDGGAYGYGLFIYAKDGAIDMFAGIDNTDWKNISSPASLTISSNTNHMAYSPQARKFCVVGNTGKIYTADWPIVEKVASNIKFSNVSGDAESHEVTEETTIEVDLSKISGDSLNFTCSNIKIVSAMCTYPKKRTIGGSIYVPDKAYGGKVKITVEPGEETEPLAIDLSKISLTWVSRTIFFDHTGARIGSRGGWNIDCLNGKGFCYGGGSGNLCLSDDGIMWHYRSPASRGDNFTGNIFHSAYGNGKYIVKANAENILISNDGINYQLRKLPVVNGSMGVAYGAGMFVTGSALALYSSDGGITWQQGNQVSGSSGYRIDYLKDKFIRVGSGGIPSYSIDGKEWKASSKTGISYGGEIYELAYGNNKFVASGSSGTLLVSDDGMSWEVYKPQGMESLNLRGLAYGSGIFLVYDWQKRGAFASVDGRNWKLLSTTPPTTCGNVGHLAYSPYLGKFCAAGSNGVSTADWSSEDAGRASSRLPTASTLKFTNITGNTTVYSVEGETEIEVDVSKINDSVGYINFDCTNIKIISVVHNYTKNVPNGGSLTIPSKIGSLELKVQPGGDLAEVKDVSKITWTQQQSGTTKRLNTIKWLKDGKFWCTGSGVILHSNDGVNWKLTNNPGNYSGDIFSLVYGNGKYIAAALSSNILISMNKGISWEKVSSTHGGAVHCVEYMNGIFVTGADGGYATYSSNGNESNTNDWNMGYFVPQKYDISWRDLIYAKDKFILVGSSSYIAYSTDGKQWEYGVKTGISNNNYLWEITYGKDKYVAAGAGIATSEDGKEWYRSFLRYTDNDGNSVTNNIDLKGITYGDGIFMAVTGGYNDSSKCGFIFVSEDAENWIQLPKVDIDSYIYAKGNKLAYSPFLKKFCLVGDSGKIYTADWPVLEPTGEGTVTFSNVSNNTSAHRITKETALYVDLSKISGDKINFSCENVDLISARISYGKEETIGGRFTMSTPGIIKVTASPIVSKARPTNVRNLGLIWENEGNFVDHTGAPTTFSNNFINMTYSNDNKFWASGQIGSIAWSDDSMNWHYLSPESRGDNFSSHLYKVVHRNGEYFAPISRGPFLYSTDTVTWRKVTQVGDITVNGKSARCMAFGNNTFVFGGYDGYTAYSIDGGVTWHNGDKLALHCDDLIFVNGKFIMAACSNVLANSTDGQTWSNGTISGTACNYIGLAYGNSKYIAVGFKGMVAVSSDAQSWSASQPSEIEKKDLKGVAYGGGIFLTAEGNGNVYASIDGTVWNKQSSSLSSSIAVDYMNELCYSYAFKKFVVGGKSGKIYTAEYDSGCGWFQAMNTGDVAHDVWNTQETVTIEEKEVVDMDDDGNYYLDFQFENVKLNVEYMGPQPGTLICVSPAAKNNITVAYDDIEGERQVESILSGSLKLYKKSDFPDDTSDDENGSYYYYKLPYKSEKKYAALFGNATDMLWDMIDFNTSTSSRYHVISAAFGGGYDKDLYTIAGSKSGQKISTQYRGDIKLTVAPSFRESSGKITIAGETKTIESQVTVDISRDSLLRDRSRKNYYIDLTLENLVILEARLIEPELFLNYPLVEPQRSSVVDFTEPIVSNMYNSAVARFGAGRGNSVQVDTHYHEGFGYWYTEGSNNNFFDEKPYSKNDSYVLLYDASVSPSNLEIWYGENGRKKCGLSLYIPGLTRHYFNAAQNNPSIGFRSYGKHYFISGGFTQPINMVLYNYGIQKGVVTSNTDNYVNYENDFNRKVLKKLTTDACTKLKSEGTRIYVVKYRAQENYSVNLRNGTDAHSKGTVSHDYSAVDSCATEGYLYGNTNNPINSQQKLTETLNIIARDIKEWGGYQKAKLVE